MCTKNHNHMRYSSWDKEWDRIICHFGPFFALLHSLPNNPENQNFQKMKKASGDVIILNLCNKKHDHMMYAYSDMECLHRHNFCHFRPLFALLPHYWPRKLKFGKNVKKTPGDIILLHMCTINQDHMHPSSFYTSVPKTMIIRYTVPEMWRETDVIKEGLEISSFYARVPKIMIRCYALPEILCVSDVIAIVHFG